MACYRSQPRGTLSLRFPRLELANTLHALATLDHTFCGRGVIALFPTACSVRQWESTLRCEPDVWSV
jgi:hypothetical protein